MVAYRQRIADTLLSEKIEAMGAVLIEGPKYCGKTTTALQQAKSALFMADPEKKEQNITLVTTNISKLLSGEAPRLIDEWQIAPKLWDAVRFEVDRRGEDGQFILTGSAVPPSNDDIFHTGTGRFAWLTMRTMSLWESGDSSGDVSLAALFKNPSVVDGNSSVDIDRLAFLICRGGWPQATQKKSVRAALMQAKEYYKAVTRSDISRVDGITRDPQRAERLMKSYARLQGAQAPVGTILADMKINDEDTLNENTIYSYINALKKIFVIEDVPAWNPNLRSKTAIRTSDTRYFTDPSIATASLGLGPEDLIDDLETMGLMFETLSIRDLRVYADAIDGTVYHYRDKSGLECDAVIHKRNGTYGLVEIKLGGDANINEGAKNLLRLSEKIDTERMKKPSFLMVLTGVGDYAYRRTDGVLVVPIGCLKD